MAAGDGRGDERSGSTPLLTLSSSEESDQSISNLSNTHTHIREELVDVRADRLPMDVLVIPALVTTNDHFEVARGLSLYVSLCFKMDPHTLSSFLACPHYIKCLHCVA